MTYDRADYIVVKTPCYPCSWKVIRESDFRSNGHHGGSNWTSNFFRTKEEAQKEADRRNEEADRRNKETD
jgi:hypothetical protein